MSTLSEDAVSKPRNRSAASAADDGGAALQLISGLKSRLAAGDLNLPALPSVVTLIHRALDRKEVQVSQITELILSEPALAGTVLKLANSPIYRRGGLETPNMDTCVNRLGTRLVHSVSLHFAMQQMKQAPEFRAVHDLLGPEWDRSRMVSELAYSLARKSRRACPEDMLTLGLIHNIGRIYILAQAGARAHDMLGNPEATSLIHEWHPLIGSAIARSWHLPDSAVRVLAEQGEGDAATNDDQRNLLILAIDLAGTGAGDADREVLALAETFAGQPIAQRLDIDAASLAEIIEDAFEFGQMMMASTGSVRFW